MSETGNSHKGRVQTRIGLASILTVLILISSASLVVTNIQNVGGDTTTDPDYVPDGYIPIWTAEDLAKIGTDQPYEGGLTWSLGAKYIQMQDIDLSTEYPSSGLLLDMTITISGPTMAITVVCENQSGTNITINAGTVLVNGTAYDISSLSNIPYDSGTQCVIMTSFDTGSGLGMTAYTMPANQSGTVNVTDLEASSNFTPIGSLTGANADNVTGGFTGTYDGNGFNIINMDVKLSPAASSSFGMFAGARGATIKSLGIVGGTFMSWSTSYGVLAGALAGNAQDCTITDCFTDSDIYIYSDGSYDAVGGLTGRASGSIDRCYNKGDIAVFANGEYSVYAGGIIGFIVGNNGLTVKNSYNSGDMLIQSSYRASVAGVASTLSFGTNSVEMCYNTGNITVRSAASSSLGGIVNTIIGDVQKCFNTGDLTINVQMPAAESGTATLGGIIASMNMISGSQSISECYNEGDLYASSTGSNSLNNANCGGIAGTALALSGLIADCYNTGTVTTVTSGTRGLAAGIIATDGSASYNVTLVNVLNVGAVSGSTTGGVTGTLTGTAYFAYYLDTAAASFGTATIFDDGSIPANQKSGSKTQAELMSQNTYFPGTVSAIIGWDFTNTWSIAEGTAYPVLNAFDNMNAFTVTGPSNATACVGDPIMFSITTDAAFLPNEYQWQRYDGSTWNSITGANSSSYVIRATIMADDNSQYRCVVTLDTADGTRQETSGAATLRVGYPVTISYETGGTGSPEGRVAAIDGALSVTMTPNQGYSRGTVSLAGFTGSPIVSGASDFSVSGISSAGSITVAFNGNPYTATLNAGSTTAAISSGSSLTGGDTNSEIVLAPVSGYAGVANVADVTMNGTALIADAEYSVFNNTVTILISITGDVVITASFESGQYTAELSSGSTSVSISNGSALTGGGTNHNIVLEPVAGYVNPLTVTAVTMNGSPLALGSGYTISGNTITIIGPITGGIEIEASYAAGSYAASMDPGSTTSEILSGSILTGGQTGHTITLGPTAGYSGNVTVTGVTMNSMSLGSGDYSISGNVLTINVAITGDIVITGSFTAGSYNASMDPLSTSAAITSGENLTGGQTGQTITLGPTVGYTGNMTVTGVTMDGTPLGSGDYSVSGNVLTINVAVTGNIVITASFPTATFSVSGKVTANDGNTAFVVSYTINSGAPQMVNTNASGEYLITGIPYGSSLVINVTTAGYTYAPSMIIQTVNSDLMDQDFSATSEATFSIAGNVAGNDGNKSFTVSYTVNGGLPQDVNTDAGGNYTISGILYGQTVVISVSTAGYTYTPPTITEIVTSGLTGRNFAAVSTAAFSVSGTVTSNDGNTAYTVSYVIDSGSSQMVNTNASGQYTITGIPYGSSVVISVTTAGYSYTPSAITQTVTSNMTGQDFAAMSTATFAATMDPGSNTAQIVSGGTLNGWQTGQTVTLGPNAGYTGNMTVTGVTMGGTPLTGADYSVSGNVMMINVAITGDVVIAASFEPVLFTASLDDTASLEITSGSGLTGDPNQTIQLGIKQGYIAPITVSRITMGGTDLSVADYELNGTVLTIKVAVTGNIVIYAAAEPHSSGGDPSDDSGFWLWTTLLIIILALGAGIAVFSMFIGVDTNSMTYPIEGPMMVRKNKPYNFKVDAQDADDLNVMYNNGSEWKPAVRTENGWTVPAEDVVRGLKIRAE